MEAERFTGTVVEFDQAKGYGFIATDTPEPEDRVFVYYADVQGQGFQTLYPEQHVEFTIQPTPKGPRAIEVVPI